MENPRHREALALFSAQSSKLRSEFVIDCILKAQQENHIEEMIRQTITDTLAGISLRPSTNSGVSPELQATRNISDLPEALICLLDDI
jgi:hypothetical protein